jgi:disulfide bond formation protein DsbB
MRINASIPLLLAASALLVACAGGGGTAAGGGGGLATAAPAQVTVAPAAQPTAPAPASGATGNAQNGKTLFAGTCVACHGPEGKGIQGLGKDLTTSAFVKSQSDAQLIDFIKKGRPASDPANTTKVDMPPKGGNPALTDANIADIVAFIRTINK